MIFTLNLLKTTCDFYASDLRQRHPADVRRIFYFYRKSRSWYHHVFDKTGSFLLPLIVIFPIFIGIDGVMYAGPIADAAAFVLAVVFARRELGEMKKA